MFEPRSEGRIRASSTYKWFRDRHIELLQVGVTNKEAQEYILRKYYHLNDNGGYKSMTNSEYADESLNLFIKDHCTEEVKNVKK